MKECIQSLNSELQILRAFLVCCNLSIVVVLMLSTKYKLIGSRYIRY